MKGVTQQQFTCSKSAIGTLEKDVGYLQSSQDPCGATYNIFLILLLLPVSSSLNCLRSVG